MAKKIILITGGLGYLGGRAALAFSKNPDYSLRLGAHSTDDRSYPRWVRDNSLDVVKIDVSSKKTLNSACKGVDFVIHLASLNEVDSFADPQKAFLINTLGTLNLIEAAQNAGVKRIIYLSTIHVYGAPLSGTITEETVPCPRHAYAVTHRAAEDFVVAAGFERKLPGIILRPANGFGVPADPFINRWKLIVNDLCRQAVTTQKLILNSSGLQSRNFITLTDIIRAIEYTLFIPMDKCSNGIFNVGEAKSTSVFELAEIIAGRCKEILGFIPPIKRQQAQKNEVMQKLDYRSDKLKATGFSLLSNFNEEIDATLRFCKKYFKNGK
ncbi:MAG: SDR family oxidoreductase [Candidatus Omnitrophica bacterium]|nr:SDR family oxidoreductase [Candidatus Omnitrophota bacterium]